MIALASLVAAGCVSGGRNAGKDSPPPPVVSLTAWSMPGYPAAGPVVRLSAAGNEWVSFTVELSGLPAGAARENLAVRVTAPADGAASIKWGKEDQEVYELAELPLDVNRAGFVRHVGQIPQTTHLPRALLPLPAADERYALASLKNEGRNHLWVDLRIPKLTVAGKYVAACEIVQKNATKPTDWKPVASLPIELVVRGFSLPDRRNLQMVAQVSWESLVRNDPDNFDAVTPHLLNREDPRYAGTVKTLDSLMRLAQRNRVSIVYPRLQPTVKWPALLENANPEVKWDDFDALIMPWISGLAFSDEVGIGYWPIPVPDRLNTYDSKSRLAYWSKAASHFDQQDWLPFSSIWVENVRPGRVRADESIEMSMDVAQLLAMHPRLAVSTPLEDDQVQLKDARQNFPSAKLIDPDHTPRLWTAVSGQIGSEQRWPEGIAAPRHWLRTDEPGLVAATDGGGNESDVRLWAWLAYLRNAEKVMFAQALPSQRELLTPADPAELVWFYPGKWFGREDPVPSVQLKWLRQAEQDFEYLNLAREKGENINTIWMSRMIAKPVVIGLGQLADPAYTLMTGTADITLWNTARDIMGRMIDLYSSNPTGVADKIAKDAIEIEILQWARPQERPMLLGRTTQWGFTRERDGKSWVSLSLGLDIYNAGEVTPDKNQLRWTGLPAGWEIQPQGVMVPPLMTYRVMRSEMGGKFNLGKLTPKARIPLELELTVDGPSAKFVSPVRIALPVAASDQREGRFKFDGKLDDWAEPDLIHDGPLVKMLSRPAVLSQTLERAQTRSLVYSNWTNDNFYVAFALEGITPADAAGGSFRNFVEYQARRAWGEDLCEVLVQPIYSDNSVGPVLHVVCKPNGSNWVERKLDPRKNLDPWEPYESTGTRYAAEVKGTRWTGELAIPWKILAHPQLELPVMLRFNFTQHRPGIGESASWAGPIDFGRDDSLTGVLHIRTPGPGNAGNAVQVER